MPHTPLGISLRTRILTWVLLLLVVLVAGTLTIVRQMQTEALTRQVDSGIRALSESFVAHAAPALAAGGWGSMIPLVQDYSTTEDFDFLAVVDEKGELIARSRPLDEGIIDTFADRPERDRPGVQWLFDTMTDEGTSLRIHVTPLTVAGEHRGHVLIGFDQEIIRQEVSRLGRSVLILGVAGLLLGAILALLLARGVTGPIERLKEAAVRIGGGDFGQTIKVETGDEIGALAETFNAMSLELKKREVEVRRAERLSAIGTTASVIAHEMKTPLQSVQTYAEMLRFKYDDPEYREKLIEVVMPQIGRLGTLVDDLLDYSREARLDRTELDLNLQLRQAASFLGDFLASHNVVIREEYRAEQRIEGDPDRLEQIFFNLIRNAVEAQVDGGAIALMTFDRDSDVLVMVADSGPGIPAETAATAFDPFFSTKAKGTGLGLAITQKLVEAHGGRIGLHTPLGSLEDTFQSAVKVALGEHWPGTDHGTCFIVRLPSLPAVE